MDTTLAYNFGSIVANNWFLIVAALLVLVFSKDVLNYIRQSVNQVTRELFHSVLPALFRMTNQKFAESVTYHQEIKNSESRKEPTLQLEPEAPVKSDDCTGNKDQPVEVACSAKCDWDAFDTPAFVRQGKTLNF